MKIKLMIPVMVCLCVMCVYAAKQSEGKVEVEDNGNGEIVVTLSETDRSVLIEGDALRKAHKHNEAIASYQNVLDMDGVDAEVRAEAQYNIGLSYTWLGDYDKAEVIFQKMLDTCKDNANAVGYAEYCLAWIEVQKGEYHEAIQRLQRSVDELEITDRELCARSEFQIGSIYLLNMNNREAANLIFSKLKENYTDTKISNHPYIMNAE